MKFALLTKSCAAVLLVQACLTAYAGRPLGTDDAGTAGANMCQVEGWLARESANSTRTLVLAPACGLGDAVEIGFELARTVPDNDTRFEGGLSVKWVDPAWKAGALNWGVKAWHGTAHSRQAPTWSATTSGVMGLMTWQVSDGVVVHGNLGFEKDHPSHNTEPLANLAVSWSPAPSVSLVAEMMAVRHQPTQLNVGARWWLLPERVALDVTTGRSTGTNSTRTTTIGLGWYGIGW